MNGKMSAMILGKKNLWLKKGSLQQLQEDFRRGFCALRLVEANFLRVFNNTVWKWIICLLSHLKIFFYKSLKKETKNFFGKA